MMFRYTRCIKPRRAQEMDGPRSDEKTENGASENKRDKDEGSSKHVLEEDGHVVEESKVLRETGNEERLWRRLKRDKLYRKRYILTMAYFSTFLIVVGLNKHLRRLDGHYIFFYTELISFRRRSLKMYIQKI